MGRLDLSFVGTGNAFAPGGLCWNGFTVNDRYLFEAPPTALPGLNTIGLDPNEIQAVVLSHHHGDHFLGLPFLILHWKYMGRTKPVQIIGPPGTEELTRSISTMVYPGVFDICFDLDFVVAKPGELLRVGDLELEPVAVQHDTKLALSLGYKAAVGGRRFGYTGDTAFCDAVVDLARHSEVLVSECASRDAKIDIHMNLVNDVPAVRNALDPAATLLLTHLGPGVVPEGLDRTFAAHDFKTYRF